MRYLSREPYIDVSKCELSLGGVESGVRVGSATTITVALKDQYGQPAVPAQPLEVELTFICAVTLINPSGGRISAFGHASCNVQ